VDDAGVALVALAAGEEAESDCDGAAAVTFALATLAGAGA